MKQLKVSIFTPERVIAQDADASFVALPAYEGEMGILPGHTEIMMQLTPGVVRYETPSGTQKVDVMGGFAEVVNNIVEVFVEETELQHQLISEEQRQEKAKVKRSLFSRDADIDIEMAELQIRKQLIELKKKHKGA